MALQLLGNLTMASGLRISQRSIHTLEQRMTWRHYRKHFMTGICSSWLMWLQTTLRLPDRAQMLFTLTSFRSMTRSIFILFATFQIITMSKSSFIGLFTHANFVSSTNSQQVRRLWVMTSILQTNDLWISQCWLGNNVISLPDMNTELDIVRTMWKQWAKDTVEKYSSSLPLIYILNQDWQNSRRHARRRSKACLQALLGRIPTPICLYYGGSSLWQCTLYVWLYVFRFN